MVFASSIFSSFLMVSLLKPARLYSRLKPWDFQDIREANLRDSCWP